MLIELYIFERSDYYVSIASRGGAGRVGGGGGGTGPLCPLSLDLLLR